MPGKKGNITSKDYKEPLRKPREKQDSSTTQDGGDDSSSAPSESEKGEPSSKVAVDSHVDESKSSQSSEEKPAHEVGNNEQESDQKAVGSQKTDANTDDSKASNEHPVKASSSTGIKNFAREDTESQTKTEKAKNINIDAHEAAKELVAEASSSITNEKFNSEDADSHATGKDEASKTEPTDKVIKLSPFAAEFVPRVAFNLQSAVNAPEFVPPSLSQQTDRPMLLRQRSDKPENELMNCVKDVLFGLTQSPGELNSYFYTLVKMLRKWLSSLDSLKEVVDLIFEYSITEPNFQYIAAKLCNMLSKEQNIVLSSGEKFRSVLMNRCRDEHLNREASLENPESAARLLGFAMFEAELFCNYRPLGESEPLKVFHRGLLEMLNTLLQNHTEDCLRCIGKILKMTGYLLDDPRFMTEDKDRKNKVDKVFSDVQELLQRPGLSESVKSLLSQVIALRTTKWDSGTSEGASGVYAYFPAEDDYFTDFELGMDDLNLDDDLTPVTNPEQWSDYYDDSDETALMHQTYKYYFPDRDNEEYSHVEDEEYYLDEDPEFDDEIDAEFEKFLQEQEQERF